MRAELGRYELGALTRSEGLYFWQWEERNGYMSYLKLTLALKPIHPRPYDPGLGSCFSVSMLLEYCAE